MRVQGRFGPRLRTHLQHPDTVIVQQHLVKMGCNCYSISRHWFLLLWINSAKIVVRRALVASLIHERLAPVSRDFHPPAAILFGARSVVKSFSAGWLARCH